MWPVWGTGEVTAPGTPRTKSHTDEKLLGIGSKCEASRCSGDQGQRRFSQREQPGDLRKQVLCF